MIKYILILITILLLTGCSNSYNECKTWGYDGIVIQTNYNNTDIHCSNGALTPDKKAVMTKNGNKHFRLGYTYTPFIKDKK